MAGDRIAARYGPVNLVRGSGLLASAGLAAALGTHSPVGAVLGFAACGAGLSCTVPQFLSSAGHADPERPGGGIARVASLGYLGLVGGPALIGGCASLAGLPAALCIPVVLALCAVFFAGIVVPARPAQDPPDGVLGSAVGAVLQPASTLLPAQLTSAERILPNRPDHDLADVHPGGLADGVHDGPRDVGRGQLRVGLRAPRRAARRRSARAGSG